MAYLKGDAVSQGTKGKKLTPKMRSFINAYFGEANFNATQAYKLSDYTDSPHAALNAAELMNHPLVAQEIERRLAMRQQKSEVKAEYLLNKLIQIIEDAEGNEKTADKLRAIELAGKSIALWKERQEISGPDGDAIKHETRIRENVADFTSRIASLAKRAGTDNVVEFPDGRGNSGS